MVLKACLIHTLAQHSEPRIIQHSSLGNSSGFQTSTLHELQIYTSTHLTARSTQGEEFYPMSSSHGLSNYSDSVTVLTIDNGFHTPCL